VSNFSFSRRKRLLVARDFARVFSANEARASHQYVLFLAHRNNLQHNRLGIVVAKKHVRKAVQRNRIKRLSREFFRQCETVNDGVDVVILARNGVDRLDNETLSTILRHQWKKLTRSLTRSAD
jgi:ribonuclease P protein component